MVSKQTIRRALVMDLGGRGMRGEGREKGREREEEKVVEGGERKEVE